jgi:flagellar P-ring protein FlgI
MDAQPIPLSMNPARYTFGTTVRPGTPDAQVQSRRLTAPPRCDHDAASCPDARAGWGGCSPLRLVPLAVALIFGLGPDLTAQTGSRLKDIAVVAGAIDNQLVGYGLVVGINGDGDRNPIYTRQMIANLLESQGLSLAATSLSSKNAAAVMVTADIPAFKKPGSSIDVTVSSIGDAKTLQGGVLIQTPLKAADGRTYATAQGPLTIGGYLAGTGGAGGASVQRNHPTVGQIINGGLVVNEVPLEIVRDNTVEVFLREPDFTSAARLAAVVNETFPGSAQAIDSTTIRVAMPPGTETMPVDFLARLEALVVEPDIPARIVINERTGTIVATSHIRISACAVSHGNITITIASSLTASQPSPFADRGETVVLPSTETGVTEERRALVPLPDMPTVERVAAALNSLGVTPRDAMAIFQAMKQAGALHAELVVR